MRKDEGSSSYECVCVCETEERPRASDIVASPVAGLGGVISGHTSFHARQSRQSGMGPVIHFGQCSIKESSSRGARATSPGLREPLPAAGPSHTMHLLACRFHPDPCQAVRSTARAEGLWVSRCMRSLRARQGRVLGPGALIRASRGPPHNNSEPNVAGPAPDVRRLGAPSSPPIGESKEFYCEIEIKHPANSGTILDSRLSPWSPDLPRFFCLTSTADSAPPCDGHDGRIIAAKALLVSDRMSLLILITPRLARGMQGPSAPIAGRPYHCLSH